MVVAPRIADPVTVEVVRHTITAIADEMEANLTRTAFSPIVYESKDFCAALLDTDGQMIQGPACCIHGRVVSLPRSSPRAKGRTPSSF